MEQGRAKVGDTLALVAFGAGLTWASAVVKIGERVSPIPVHNTQQRIASWLSALNPLGSRTSIRQDKLKRRISRRIDRMRRWWKTLGRGETA
jgi:hypothetical protein